MQIRRPSHEANFVSCQTGEYHAVESYAFDVVQLPPKSFHTLSWNTVKSEPRNMSWRIRESLTTARLACFVLGKMCLNVVWGALLASRLQLSSPSRTRAAARRRI